jgi:hypothetical protein
VVRREHNRRENVQRAAKDVRELTDRLNEHAKTEGERVTEEQVAACPNTGYCENAAESLFNEYNEYVEECRDVGYGDDVLGDTECELLRCVVRRTP